MDNYNGWKNYETWNVALWLGNSKTLEYFMKVYKGRKPYRDFLHAYNLESESTGDGVPFLSNKVSLSEMNSFMWEVKHG